MTPLRHSTTCDYLVRHRSCDCRLSRINPECQQGRHADCDTRGWGQAEGRFAACSCTCHPGQSAVLRHLGKPG